MDSSLRLLERPTGAGTDGPSHQSPPGAGGAQAPNSVKGTFTPMGQRGHGFKDPDEFAAGVARQIKRLGVLAGGHDAAALARLLELHAEIDAAARVAARLLHEGGDSYAVIAGEVGMTRQAVYQRWFKGQAAE